MKRLTSRFWSKVDKTRSCWLWTGSKTKDKGYGQMFLKGRLYLCHRLSWEDVNGSIPEGGLVLHRCDNPLCVNPAHLFLGDQKDNVRDCISKGRFAFNGGANKGKRGRKTHCSHGHLFDDENTFVDGYGYFRCRKCQRRHTKNSCRRCL